MTDSIQSIDFAVPFAAVTGDELAGSYGTVEAFRGGLIGILLTVILLGVLPIPGWAATSTAPLAIVLAGAGVGGALGVLLGAKMSARRQGCPVAMSRASGDGKTSV